VVGLGAADDPVPLAAGVPSSSSAERATPASKVGTGDGAGAAPEADPSGATVAVIVGRVRVDTVRPSFWGRQLLAGAVAASVAVVAVGGGAHTAREWVMLAVPLCFGAAVLAGYVFAVRLLRTVTAAHPGRRSAAGRPSGGAGMAAPGGAGVIVSRFQLQSMAGEVMDCVLRGEPRGVALRAGVIVRAKLRRGRDGTHDIRQLDIMATPAGPVVRRVALRFGHRFLLARWSSLLLAMTGVAILTWTALVVLAGGLG
jgi:hypothetical protein